METGAGFGSCSSLHAHPRSPGAPPSRAAPRRMSHVETLLLRPLADGAVEAVFEFRDSWRPEPINFCASGDTNALCHFDSARFPRVLAEVVDEFDVAEMHVALTRGRWDRSAWGHSAADDTHGPDGAEMWAKLPVRSDRSAVARWDGLRAAVRARRA